MLKGMIILEQTIYTKKIVRFSKKAENKTTITWIRTSEKISLFTVNDDPSKHKIFLCCC